jgi:hypothetical protein
MGKTFIALTLMITSTVVLYMITHTGPHIPSDIALNRKEQDTLEHHLLWSEESAYTMCNVGIEQCLLWCEVSTRRQQHGDPYDILAHEIAWSWRDWTSICLHISTLEENPS